MKTKAQMNWEIGKEQQDRFLLDWQLNKDRINWDYDKLFELLIQIRQTEYRRGKEDAKKEFLSSLSSIKKIVYEQFSELCDKETILNVFVDTFIKEVSK